MNELMYFLLLICVVLHLTALLLYPYVLWKIPNLQFSHPRIEFIFRAKCENKDRSITNNDSLRISVYIDEWVKAFLRKILFIKFTVKVYKYNIYSFFVFFFASLLILLERT